MVATSAVSTPRSVLLSADCLLQRSAGAGAETFLARLGLALGFPPLLFAAAFAAIAAAALIPRKCIPAASRRSHSAVFTDETEATEIGAGAAMLSSPMTRRAVVSLFVTLFTIYPTVWPGRYWHVDRQAQIIETHFEPSCSELIGIR